MKFLECDSPYKLEMKRMEIARKLIGYQLRPPQVAITTFTNQKKLRLIWNEMHKSSPPKGLQPHSCAGLLKKRDMRDVATFIAIFRSIIPKNSLNPEGSFRKTSIENLIDAYEIYLTMFEKKSQVLEFQTCFYLIRDIRYDIATIATCGTCKCEFLETANDKAFWGCPFCN